jgi:hypothetical protein
MRVKGEGNVKKGRKHDSKMRHKGCGEASIGIGSLVSWQALVRPLGLSREMRG